MPTPTLVATPASATANSYATVAEADAYHDSRLHREDWAATGSDVATKTVALIMATRLLDSMYEWSSWSTHSLTQALQWPRISMMARNRLSYIDNETIPTELKNATAEFARQLIAEDRAADNDIETKRLREIGAGPVRLVFGEGVTAKVVPDAVYSLMPPWWGTVRGRVSATRDLVRA
jgi:Putative DnaT-like ssDNA binding protein